MKNRSMIYSIEMPPQLSTVGVFPRSSGIMEAYSFDSHEGGHMPVQRPKKAKVAAILNIPRQSKPGRVKASYLSPKAQFGRKSFNFE
jgi:hypothetical protein